MGSSCLDPAIGLDPTFMQEVAELTIGSPDYTDAAEAYSEKIHGSWGEVPTQDLDVEMAEHLIELGKRTRQLAPVHRPAIVTGWGELARPIVLPPSSMPTVLVQAMKVQPPYVTAELRAALTEHLGENLTGVEFDCDHMVPHVRADEVAALVRSMPLKEPTWQPPPKSRSKRYGASSRRFRPVSWRHTAISLMLQDFPALARSVGSCERTLPTCRGIGFSAPSGKPSAHLAHRQIAKLELEGVPIKDGRIDLKKARYHF